MTLATDLPVFLFGTLCHPPLRAAVLGRDLAGRQAVLRDHAAMFAEDRLSAVAVAQAGATVSGEIFEDLTPRDRVRLHHYLAAVGSTGREVEIDGRRAALHDGHERSAGAAWSPVAWAATLGAVATAAATDVMGMIGLHVPQAIAARRSQMLIRAASRLRAARPAPATVRRAAAPGDVAVDRWRQPYAHFFAVEEMDLRFRRFGGEMSEPVNRAAFISGDAVTVMPYDPMRDRVLLIEQFRAGPFARGDANPWSLEVIAGRIDAGETPEEAGRREAVEEAGLALADLIPVSRYYPSPGAKSEYIYSYLALAELPDALAGGVGGVADEAEDIRTHLVSFDRLMELVETAEIENAPLVISALSLARLRPRLRGAA